MKPSSPTNIHSRKLRTIVAAVFMLMIGTMALAGDYPYGDFQGGRAVKEAPVYKPNHGPYGEMVKATLEKHPGTEAQNRTSIMDLGANASFYSSKGCIDTYVFVFVNNWPYWFDGAPSHWVKFQNSASPGGLGSGTFISIYQQDACDDEALRHALGFAPASAHTFTAMGDVSSAALTATIEVFDYVSSTTYDVDVELTWTSTSELSRGNGNWHYQSPGFDLSGHFNGTYLAAEALGSIRDGAGNLTLEASSFAQLMRVNSGRITLDE